MTARVAAGGSSWPVPELLLVTDGGYTFHRRSAQRLPRGLLIGAGRVLELVDPDERAARRELARVPELRVRGVAVPGFVDAHTHYPTAGRDTTALATAACTSLDELLSCLGAAAARTPAGQWIAGEHSLTVSQLGMPRPPTAAELDAATTEHPVAVRFGAHVMSLNTLGLRASGLADLPDDPPQGRLDRAGDGRPLGPIREYGALRHVLDKLPPAGRGDALAGLHLAGTQYARQGVTTARVPGLRPGELAAYQQLRRSGRGVVRVGACLRMDPNEPHADKLRRIRDQEARTGLGDELLWIDAVKIFVDGGIETALAGEQHRFLSGEELLELTAAAVRGGWSVTCHAVSNEAVDLVLAAYEPLFRLLGGGQRLVIEHGFFVDRPRLARMAALGVWYSTQLAPCSVDARYAAAQRPEWLAGCCPLASALQLGVATALGSDWNALPGSDARPFPPLATIAAAVSRRSVYGEDLGQAETVTVTDAFYLHTRAGAELLAAPALGGLFPGAAADVAVLAADPMELPPGELARLPVAATLVAGQPVWSSGVPAR